MSVTIRPITTPNTDRHVTEPLQHAGSRSQAAVDQQLCLADRVVPLGPQAVASTIDCAVCVHLHTSVCDDCVVTFILDRNPEDAVVLDVQEERAVRMLGRAGLVPGVRHRLADRDAG